MQWRGNSKSIDKLRGVNDRHRIRGARDRNPRCNHDGVVGTSGSGDAFAYVPGCNVEECHHARLADVEQHNVPPHAMVPRMRANRTVVTTVGHDTTTVQVFVRGVAITGVG